jgi:small-conductance mechanosensitive channel
VPDLLSQREPWLAAAALLLIGAVTALLVGGLVSALSRRVVGDRERATRLAAGSVWAVLIVFAIAALSRLLGPDIAQPGLAAAATRLFARLPDVLIALVLVAVGLVLAAGVRLLTRRALRPVQPAAADPVATLGYWVVVGIAVLLAAEQVGIRTGAVERIALVLLAAIGLALALALGLGARDLVAAIMAGRHVAHIVSVGDEIEVGGHDGTVVALGHASVRLRTATGEVEVPNAVLLRSPVVVIDRAGGDDTTRAL